MSILTEKWRIGWIDVKNRYEEGGTKTWHHIVTVDTVCEVVNLECKELAEHMVLVHNKCLELPSCPKCKGYEVVPDYGREFAEGREDDNPFKEMPWYCGHCNHTWGGD